MDYKKGIEVLPEELIAEIQKYISGSLIYIPKVKNMRKEWGEVSGVKEEIRIRNCEIKHKFSKGYKIDQLADEYCLAIETIKKIVYKK